MLIMLINHYEPVETNSDWLRKTTGGHLNSFSYFSSRFGPPFLMREDRSISWDQLQQSILSKLYYLMINGAQAQVLDSYQSQADQWTYKNQHTHWLKYRLFSTVDAWNNEDLLTPHPEKKIRMKHKWDDDQQQRKYICYYCLLVFYNMKALG